MNTNSAKPDDRDERRTPRGRVVRPHHVTRDAVRAAPDTLFVFGDNMARKGFGGQAAAMRGEPNAIGVPTKWNPGRLEMDYFSDESLRDRTVWGAIHDAFEQMRAALAQGKDVVIPTDGLGTGLAELPTRAPRVHQMIEDAIRQLEAFVNE